MSPNPPKIVVIGAGSAIFGLGALSTIIQHPAMKGAELALFFNKPPCSCKE